MLQEVSVVINWTSFNRRSVNTCHRGFRLLIQLQWIHRNDRVRKWIFFHRILHCPVRPWFTMSAIYFFLNRTRRSKGFLFGLFLVLSIVILSTKRESSKFYIFFLKIYLTPPFHYPSEVYYRFWVFPSHIKDPLAYITLLTRDIDISFVC